ncbi:hypothetical protein PQU92_13590 [Asticcacaulis sp. BYS171W]|uniref:DUF2029 domain-containing protein n=1 Tax=Asticcacaulis aquaticus TaxID=2984212 RepID=A0ABT5HW72_9CAUL|nr:hypothetical protein [Asticcacaulis aquaticus]MDC7684315.1 hypothetical protein [Asticcacaulis aquaticus]
MSLFSAPVKRALLIFLFALPLLSGVVGKISKSNAWFGDYRAVACGAQKIIDGGALYDMNLKCEDMDGTTAVYVYLPVVAEAFAAVVRVIGQDGLFVLYTGLYVLSLAVLFWGTYCVLPGTKEDSTETESVAPTLMQKLPFAAFLTGSAIVWGNIAVLGHAAVLASAMTARRFPWLFVAVVALCGVVKPVFLTYLAVVLFLDFSVWKRLGLFIAGAVAGVLPTVLFAAEHSPLSEQWRQTLSYFVYSLTPGESFYGWLSLVGIRADSSIASIGWLVFAGLMTLSGLAIAEGLRLSSRARIWLGLSLGVLMIPRLMSQDVFLIGVGLVYAALHARDLSAPSKPLMVFKDRGLTILTVLCLLCLIGGAAELGDYTTRLATLGLSLYVLTLGVLTFAQRRDIVLSALLPRLKTSPQ